MKICSSN